MEVSNHELSGVKNIAALAIGGVIEPWLIVIHYTANQSAAGTIEWFKSALSKVSAHVVVDADGTISADLYAATTTLNVRSGPGVSHAPVPGSPLQPGQRVRVVDVHANWWHVSAWRRSWRGGCRVIFCRGFEVQFARDRVGGTTRWQVRERV
jgi:N-acetyl-anhydromuramyl-L-alanine amidase AmpD